MDIHSAISEGSVHWGNCTREIGPRGGIKEHSTVARISGQLKTWKTRPGDFRLPVKHGMRGYGEIVPSNIAQFHLPSECPLLADGEVANNVHNVRIQTVTVPILGDREFYRALCTCGFVGKEHFFSFEAELDAKTHAS
jgi:hypothetical protein